MKKMIKKITIFTLFLTLCLTGLFSAVKTPSAGPADFGDYTEKDVEMRAVWVATVSNLNISAQIGKGEKAINAWKEQYLEILDNAEASNLNTIIFQIRPANDAFYPSKYNPWSIYLSPDGTDPGWDPLEWMIEVTHERGLEYHAWLNPYRASVSTLGKSITSTDSVTSASSVIDYDTKEYNEYKENYFSKLRENNPDISNPVLQTGENLYHDVLFGTEGKLILNPASTRVQEHIENTIEEIVDKYDIDGIHFDDYFYPKTASYKGSNTEYKNYTFSCEPSVDMADYKEYLANCKGEALSIYDWRRENVNTLIKNLGILIREKNETKETKCAFGISPAARWAPTVEACSSAPERGAEGGMSGSCYNYYSYSDLYADTYKWAVEEWIDYIVPQNYTNLDGDYLSINKWWTNALKNSKTKVYVGTALYQITSTWSSSGKLEIYYQVRQNETKNYDIDGYVLFSYSSMVDKVKAPALKYVTNYCWKTNSLTPLYDSYTYEKQVSSKATIKNISLNNGKVTLDFNEVDGAKAYGLYKFSSDEEFEFDVSHRVGLKLNNNTPFTFAYDEEYKYVLVTFDQDNTIYSEYEVVDFNNEAPVVNVTLDKTTYKPGEKATINVAIEDNDSEMFTVKAEYIDGTTKQTAVVKNNVSSKALDIEYQLPNSSSSTGYILVTVSDGTNNVEVEKQVNIKNEKPTVTISAPSSSKVDEEMVVKISVTDDSDTLKYKVYFSAEDDEFIYTVETGNITLTNGKGELEIKYSFNSATTNGKFKVVISDNEFDVSEVSQIVKITAANNNNNNNNSSTCQMGMAVNQILSLTASLMALVLIFRKKGNR